MVAERWSASSKLAFALAFAFALVDFDRELFASDSVLGGGGCGAGVPSTDGVDVACTADWLGVRGGAAVRLDLTRDDADELALTPSSASACEASSLSFVACP